MHGLEPGEKCSGLYGKSFVLNLFIFYLFIYFKNSLRKFLNSFSNDRNSAYFDNIRLKLSKHAYSEVRFHPILSKYEDSKNRFL